MQRKTEKETPSGKILIAAFECLSTRGYANVSMRDIADEAGVALSQLTYYYKNKERLFTEVINMMMDQYLNEIEVTLESTTDTKDKIASLVRFFKELIRDKPNLLKLFIDFTAQALWIPSFRKQLDSLFNALTEIIERNLPIDTVVNRNSLGYSSKCIAKLIFGALFGTSIQIILGSERDSAFESLNLAECLLY
ncbi:MAG TPA: TetR/AcrR family transcriptional regulator [Candidatus Avimonas sp.]|jgi:AcrR family transcriptional regulator|uniref:TetR/AcrR family transcriptional regulator n=1 Tax=Thermoclostridium caenicola TaxID=659425 RepID=UPI002D183849|nr:TetR/AcrR family transcriptional regulator [Thermoclostridium caenicola]HPO77719.1 TetR/AcrR family transcriptional regulator [Thermoclostridium caenicola]HQA15816.1 TetR/AcrR family transcriptional regulator [Candidatus Avimonas sp.]